jgi:AraC-like DNA-binding protein
MSHDNKKADKNKEGITALGWISARHLQHMLARGQAVGVQVDELLEAAGLLRGQLVDTEAMVPLPAVETMLGMLAQRYADPLLGLHFASDIQPATFGAIGYISQACATFGDVLEVMTRYNGLLSNIGQTSVIHHPGLVEIRWDCHNGGPAFRRQASEYVLGSFTVLTRLLLPDQKTLPLAVNFAHAVVPDAEQAREYFDFFRCPVYFGKPASSLLVPAALLNVSLPHGDAFMKELLERHTTTLLEQRRQATPLPEVVRQLVSAMMIDGAPGRDDIARQLGLSGRSLHRRLEEADTSFREILDEVRLTLAKSQLHPQGDVLSVIASRLGFASHQAFMRWFKAQTGTTPGQFRQEQNA